jgi:hypothetical protein
VADVLVVVGLEEERQEVITIPLIIGIIVIIFKWMIVKDTNTRLLIMYIFFTEANKKTLGSYFVNGRLLYRRFTEKVEIPLFTLWVYTLFVDISCRGNRKLFRCFTVEPIVSLKGNTP